MTPVHGVFSRIFRVTRTLSRKKHVAFDFLKFSMLSALPMQFHCLHCIWVEVEISEKAKTPQEIKPKLSTA